MNTMEALRQLEYGGPLEVCRIAMPQAESGTAVVKILAATIISYTKDIYNGVRKYPYPTPLTAGSSAIGRIHDLGPDSTSLKKNDLVLVDILIRARDDPSHAFLSAIHEGYTPGSKKLMSHWRDGTYADYVAVPLENCYVLNESRLLGSLAHGGQGYSIQDLLYLPTIIVPYGGLADINLRPGETIIVAPATGNFGGAAVHCALSMGATVIAMGRNRESLRRLSDRFSSKFPAGRLVTVPMTGDLDEEIKALRLASDGSPIDAFFDISPPQASKSTHLKAAIMSLKHSGRVSLMGGQTGDVAIPHSRVMHWNLNLRGKWMFERQDLRDLIRMVQGGTVLLGERGGLDGAGSMKGFRLDEWKEAFDWAETHVGGGVGAYFKVAE